MFSVHTRVAQLAGVAMAAGLGTIVSGYEIGLMATAVVSIAGALTVAFVVPPALVKRITRSRPRPYLTKRDLTTMAQSDPHNSGFPS
jgi:hypothetical protein